MNNTDAKNKTGKSDFENTGISGSAIDSKKYRISVKKENRFRAHIVVHKGQKYCLWGWDYLTKEEQVVIKKGAPDNILKELKELGYKMINE